MKITNLLNLKDAETQRKTPTLFDLLELNGALQAANVEAVEDATLEMQAEMADA